MSTSTLNLGSASIAASTAAVIPARPGAVRRAALAVWHALKAVGQQRAGMYLLDMADAYADVKPEFARQMRLAARRRGAV